MYRALTLFFCINLFSAILYGQDIGFYSNRIVLPASNPDSAILLFSYKISASLLIFEKKDQNYISRFRLNLEVIDSLQKYVVRNVSDAQLSLKTFSETKNKYIYYEGVIQITLPNGLYKFVPSLSDINSQNERKFQEIYVSAKVQKKNIYAPFTVVSDSHLGVLETDKLSFLNFGTSLPFEPINYFLVIPIADTSIYKIYCQILNDKDTNQLTSEKFMDHFPVTYNSGNKFIFDDKIKVEPSIRYFFLGGLNGLFGEAKLKLKISSSNNFQDSNKVFFTSLTVQWMRKPESLRNLEFAIRLLSIVYPKEIVDSLLSQPEESYSKVLEKFWKRFDPTPKTTYNELFSQFYERVDYAIESFSSLTKFDGAESDRGKIYIRFGNPDEKVRSYEAKDLVSETWIYKKGRNFRFVDRMGKGFFQLESSN